MIYEKLTNDVVIEFINDFLIDPDVYDKDIVKDILCDTAKYQKIWNWSPENYFVFNKKHYEAFEAHRDEFRPNLYFAARSKKLNKIIIRGYNLKEMIGKKTTLGKLFIDTYILGGNMNMRSLIPMNKVVFDKGILKKKDINVYAKIYATLLKDNRISPFEAITIHDRYTHLGQLFSNICPPFQDAMFSNSTEEEKFIQQQVKIMFDKMEKEQMNLVEESDFTLEMKEKLVAQMAKKYYGTREFYQFESGVADLMNAFGDSKVFKGVVTSITSSKRGGIVLSNYSDGYKNSELKYAKNINLNASNARAKSTAAGGYMVKITLRALKSIRISRTVKDCHTTMTKKQLITEKNMDEFVRRFIVSKGKLIKLTYDNIENYFGKEVNLRTPLYCLVKKNGEVCETCAGETYRRIGMEGIGSANGRTSSNLFNANMKKMHNIQTEQIKIDINDYMDLSKDSEQVNEILKQLA